MSKLVTKKYKEGDRCEIHLSKEMADQLNLLEELGFTPQNCKVASFTFESKQYDLLTKLLGNRTVVDKNVDHKKELLEKNGFKSTNPVIINKDGQMIDGQHRRLAAEQLDMPFKFTIDVSVEAEESLQTTIELNNSGKPWVTLDYINAYAENGNEEYEKLLDLCDELNLGMSKTLILYLGAKANIEFQRSIARGSFKFDENKAQLARNRKEELDLLSELVTQRYKKLVESQPFYCAYLELSRKENFKFKVLKEQFDKMRYTVLDRKNLMETLIETYNMQRRTNRIS